MTVRRPRIFLPVLALGLFFGRAAAQPAPAAENSTAAPPPAYTPRSVAIFVENYAGADWGAKADTFENLVASRIASSGFSVISRDVAVNALATVGGNTTAADQLLATQTTALSLAQNLHANYLFLVTLTSYGIDNRSFSGYGITTVNRIAILRASYRFCDAGQGGALLGGTASASQTIPQNMNFAQDNGDLQNQLLDQLATNLATDFLQNLPSANLTSTAAPAPVPFSVSCSMADILLPDILAAPDHQYVVRPLAYTVEPLDVTVELNGLALGSAPGNFTGPAGLNKLRLSRQGFKTQELNVNLSPGFNLHVALQMDDQGYARWQQSLSYLQGLKQTSQITDADADRIRGIAQMFRQSGMLLNQSSNITATSLPPVQQVYPSLLSMPAPVWGAPSAPGAPASGPAPVPAPASAPAPGN